MNNRLSFKPFRKKVNRSNTEKNTIGYPDKPCRGNIIAKSYNQQGNGAQGEKNPRTELEHPLNGLHPTHKVLQAFLDISPISLMLDIGNRIIDRKGKRVNHDL